jgi:two-component system, OmpR family, osmolarity sensor histidine kinase EnvZ
MSAPRPSSFLPRSLFGRALLILMVPIVVLQLVVGFLFFQRHYQRVTDQMTRGVAMELNYAAERVEAAEDAAGVARALADLQGPLNLRLAFDPGATVTPEVRRNWLDLSGRVVVSTLDLTLRRPVAIDLATAPRNVAIALQTDIGVLRAAVPRDRLSVSNPHQLLVVMSLSALVLSAIALLFLRNQVRPIRRLAEAADAFGKGRSVPLRPAGAEEVRRASAAFLSMRTRLERQIEQRTQMLSGVSHDLRTPLTRMKLTLALMDEGEEVAHLRRDVDEMERMLAEFLAFARGEGTEETTLTDPFAMARAIVEDARRSGTAIELTERNETPRNSLVAMRPGAVQRAVQNLVGNAARHGRHVALAVRLLPKTVDFVVEDDGPGIAPEDRARALQPFARLDPARNLNAGGNVGLGLTIALDVARSHGGSLELGASPALGGLRADLRLPR